MHLDPGSFAPIAVARRSGADESIHHGAAAVLDPDGRLVASIGDPDTAVYLRSALKIVQSTALVELGLHLPDRLLALVAASHSGEQMHLDGVHEILHAHGLGVDDLANTPALPYGESARRAALEAGAAATPLFQNCSGKHAGMLAAARINGWPTEGYLAVDHPVQAAIRETTETLGAPVEHIGVDGCGAPAFVVPIRAASVALGRLAAANAPALRAMRTAPDMVGGSGRDVTEWMRAVPGLVAKDGAAGAMALVMADGDRRGWSAVFKIADGSDAARRAVIPSALRAMGVDVERAVAVMTERPEVEVLGGGRRVGSIEALPLRPVGSVAG